MSREAAENAVRAYLQRQTEKPLHEWTTLDVRDAFLAGRAAALAASPNEEAVKALIEAAEDVDLMWTAISGAQAMDPKLQKRVWVYLRAALAALRTTKEGEG